MTLVAVGRVCFDYRNCCRRFVKVRIVRFDLDMRLVEVPRVRFEDRISRRRFVAVRRVRFVNRKACMMLVEVRRVRINSRKAFLRFVGGL